MTWNVMGVSDTPYHADSVGERQALLGQPLTETPEPWEDGWAAMSDCFLTIHHPVAQCCLRCLYDTDGDISARQKASAFITLKSLANPGFQPYFQSQHSSGQMHFFVLDEQGEKLPGMTCSLPVPTQQATRWLADDIDGGFYLAEEINQLYRPSLQNDEALSHLARLVIFGDSLSDSDARMFHKSFGLLPSSDQHYRGRFTNGFVWTDFISSPSFLKKSMVNYAEGGSPSASYTSWLSSWLDMFMWFFSSLNKQMAHHQGRADDLTIISMGANDYMTYHKGDVKKVIDNQAENIEKLLAQGVKNIMVFGVPDLSLTPYARHLPQHDEQQRLWAMSCEHNRQLAAKVDDLQVLHPDATFVFFDISKAFADVFIRAEMAGYNVTDAYDKQGYIHLFGKHYGINIDPRYLFNDDVHPTQEVHWILALMTEDVIRRHFAR